MAYSRERGQTARRHADLLCGTPLEARPAGVHRPQLLRATSLTSSQARSGLATLRDQIATRGWPPLVWTRAEGYLFPTDPDLLHLYEVAVFRRQLTELRRFLTAVVLPHAAHDPEDRWLRVALAQLNAMEASLGLITRPA
ncbi:RacP protein [Streptomyces longispororuber]|uniref:RacP protein n=1 Tax=Streptomyces longispororuber TaxID=68230 RepID=UPI0036F96B9A